MREGCYDCARAEWDSEGATCGINGLHVDRPSLGCNKRIPKKRMTNGDRVRAMTDEELAKMVGMEVCRIVKPDGKDCPKGFYFGKCDKCVISWLKKEAKTDD